MAHLTFKHENLRDLLTEAKKRWKYEVRTLYGEDHGPGFWIVGDEGVYLMHNGKVTKAPKQHVVYAEECNPETLPFDTWWEEKNLTFGADDGADFIERDIIEQAVEAGSDVVIEFTSGEMKMTLPGLYRVQFKDKSDD